jgi:hypothetical protein
MVKAGLPSLRGFGFISSLKAILSLVFWVFGGIGLFATAWFHLQVGLGAWLAVYTAAISYSILASGHPWPHYLIQLAPLFALGVGGGIFLFWSSSVALGLVSALAMLYMAQFLAVKPAGKPDAGNRHVRVEWPTYQRFVGRLFDGVDPYYGPVFDVANHLKQIAKPGETFFFDEDVLAYWLLHTSPVVPIAGSPSIICFANTALVPVFGPGMTTRALLEKILSRTPDRVVLKQTGFVCPVFDDDVRNCLLKDYEVEDDRFDRMVFRRKTNSFERSLTDEPQTCFEAPGGNAP